MSALLLPVAGMTSRSNAPGWVGHRFGSRLAAYSAMVCSSMVLLEIDAERISGLELERDAPRSVDVHRVNGREKRNVRITVKCKLIAYECNGSPTIGGGGPAWAPTPPSPPKTHCSWNVDGPCKRGGPI